MLSPRDQICVLSPMELETVAVSVRNNQQRSFLWENWIFLQQVNPRLEFCSASSPNFYGPGNLFRCHNSLVIRHRIAEHYSYMMDLSRFAVAGNASQRRSQQMPVH